MILAPKNDQHHTLALAVLVICVNTVLMIVKICTGLIGNSYALVADGIESAGDIFTSLISWSGYFLSLKPADDNHPYGHGGIESLAALISGFSLMGAALLIAYHSVQEILHPHQAPSWFTLPVLIGVILLKAFISKRVSTAAEDLNSSSLKGDAWHHISDAITSAAAAIGISLALFLGPGWEPADDWAALVACTVICWNGFLIVRGAAHDVMDGTVEHSLYEQTRTEAEKVPGVCNTEKCRIRKSGTNHLIELHIRVDPDITVHEGHHIAHEVKRRLMRQILKTADVIIHVEPASKEGHP